MNIGKYIVPKIVFTSCVQFSLVQFCRYETADFFDWFYGPIRYVLSNGFVTFSVAPERQLSPPRVGKKKVQLGCVVG